MADIVLINPRFEISYWGLEVSNRLSLLKLPARQNRGSDSVSLSSIFSSPRQNGPAHRVSSRSLSAENNVGLSTSLR
jgi:hypothetical protein